MIEIIPAIDLIDGKCVRLTQGDYATRKTYHEDPLDVARRFEDAGLKRLHLVDLDGAKAGRVVNYKVLERLAAKTSLKIDFGGGIRSDKDLEIAFDCGALQITAGSIAVKQKDTVCGWLEKYGPEKIIIGADVRDEKVAIHGWQESSDLYVFDFLCGYREKQAVYTVCTDVSKDGMLAGPAFELYNKIMSEVEGIRIIASGGVSCISDVEKLQDQGVYAVIIGKAIYEGKILISDLSGFVC